MIKSIITIASLLPAVTFSSATPSITPNTRLSGSTNFAIFQSSSLTADQAKEKYSNAFTIEKRQSMYNSYGRQFIRVFCVTGLLTNASTAYRLLPNGEIANEPINSSDTNWPQGKSCAQMKGLFIETEADSD